MTDAIAGLVANGGWGAVSLVLALVLMKLIEKHRPKTVVAGDEADLRRQEMDDLRMQVSFWRSETEQNQKDITELRTELRRMSAERHYYYVAVNQCIVDHPVTGQWWADKLAEIQTKIGA